MYMPPLKPQAYEALSILEKAKFILECLDKRIVEMKKAERDCGDAMGFAIPVLEAIRQYIEQACQSVKEMPYALFAERYPDLFLSLPTSLSSHPLNGADLEAAYQILAEHALSNEEYFTLIKDTLKNIKVKDKCSFDVRLTPKFFSVVENKLKEAEKNWQAFCQKHHFTDAQSKTYRNAIKGASVAAGSLAFAYSPFSLFTVGTMCLSTMAYTHSGAIGDILAKSLAPEPERASLRKKS